MNDLIVVDKIEKQLREPRVPIVFPLTPTHRKELRNLRNANIGGLRDRLRTIETLKMEEYNNKYSKEIISELDKYRDYCNSLNEDWKQRLKKINKIIDDRKKLEDKRNISNFDLKTSYDDISKLETVKSDRLFVLDIKNKTLSISNNEFNKKYGKIFNEIEEKIDKVVTQYEEAINFGDLEIVKKLYYMMKGADDFFKKVSELKI